MSPQLSAKIRNLTLLAIFGVLFIHSYNFEPRYLQPTTQLAKDLPMVGVVEFAISNSLTRWVIPLLFGLSGYLFFFSATRFREPYAEKFIKRLGTVLRPYLVWNWLAAGLLVVLGVVPWIKVGLPDYLRTLGFWDWFWGLTFNPINFPLWYLRDLLLLVMVAPALASFLNSRWGRWLWWVSLVGAYVLNINWPFFNADAWLFFNLGAWLGLQGHNLRWAGRRFLAPALAVAWVAVVVLHTGAAVAGWGGPVVSCLYKLSQLAGLAAVWLGYDWLSGDSHREWPGVRLSFYLFAGHQPLMILLINPLLAQVPDPTATWWPALVYVLLPLGIGGLWLGLGGLLKVRLPAVHGFLTGDR